MIFLRILILLTIITSNLILAQKSNFGLRLEFYTYNIEKLKSTGNYTSENELTYMPGFYVFYSHNISQEFSISVKPGVIISDNDLSGFDLGCFIRYKFPTNNFYTFSGINLINIKKPGGGQSFIEKISDPIYFLSIGAGYNFNKHISADLSYFHPLERSIGKTYIDPDFNNLSGSPIKLYNIIKLSIEFII